MNPMSILCYGVAAAMAIATAALGYSQRMLFPADSLIIIAGIVTQLVVMGYLLRRRR